MAKGLQEQGLTRFLMFGPCVPHASEFAQRPLLAMNLLSKGAPQRPGEPGERIGFPAVVFRR